MLHIHHFTTSNMRALPGGSRWKNSCTTWAVLGCFTFTLWSSSPETISVKQGLGWMIVSGRPESVFWLIIKKNNWISIELVKSCCSIMTVVWVQSSTFFLLLSCSNCCWNNRTSSGSAVRVLCRDQLKIEWIVRGVTLIHWSVHNKRETIPP